MSLFRCVDGRARRARPGCRIASLSAITLVTTTLFAPGVRADATDQTNAAAELPPLKLELSPQITLPEADTPPVIDTLAAPSAASRPQPEPITAPQPATPPQSETAATSGAGWLATVLLMLCGGLVGAMLARRAPRDQTPAQDRLADDLARLRDRYLNVIAQREQRRDDNWESTVTTLRSDVVSARALLDNQRDQCGAFEADLSARQREIEALPRDRDDTLHKLDTLQAIHAATERELAEVKTSKQTLEEWQSSTNEENRSLIERLEALQSEADQAKVLRARVQELEGAVSNATAEAAEAQASMDPIERENSHAQRRIAEMLDKNLALEAELARLKERLSIVDKAHARQVAELLEERREGEQSRAQHEVTLQNQLREANAAFVKREAELSERTGQLQDQLAQSDDAKRRLLMLLRQEKTDAASASSELESLRVDHAHILEQFDSVQGMLSTAEDRIDDQDRRIEDLQDENKQLRAEIEQRDTGEFQRVSRELKSLRVETDDISVREHMYDDKLLRTIEQLTRSRDNALEEITRLKAMQMPVSASDPQSVREAGSLNDARMTIRSLEADLRVRGDLIDALRGDIERLQNADTQLETKDTEIARLKNELSMALDETSRLRNLGDTLAEHQSTRPPSRDVLRLRERLDALQERLELKEKEIAILRSATGTENDDSPLHEHVSRLEADQEASVTVIRFLESEVEKLSRELRDSSAAR